MSLIPRLIRAAESPHSLVVIQGDEETSRRWSEVHERARRLAAALQARGIGPGDRVALLGPTTPELVDSVQAIWLTGGTLVMLPLPMRLASIDAFVEETRARIAAADVAVVVVDDQLAPFVEPRPGDPSFVLLGRLQAEADAVSAERWERPPDDPEALALLQFTSGSTAEPKGVMIPHATMCANLDACAEAGAMTDDEVFVSWLPLYHDMGLVGMLGLPMTSGRGLVQAAPQDFLARPSRWLDWITRHRGTATAGPNFAYALGRRALRRGGNWDLSSMQVLLNGAEPIDPRTFRSFLDVGATYGLRADAAFCAFGLAEVCIGATFPERGGGFRTDRVDAERLERDGVAQPSAGESARELAMLGRAVPGLELRIESPETGAALGEREVGELLIRGSSVTPGYWRRPDATERLIRDGWLHTGDLAYTVDGQLVVCGRIKDVIIVGGRNLHPQDIERAAGEVEGIRTGNAVAFGVDGRAGAQSIVVVAELGSGEQDVVAGAVSAAVTTSTGVPPKEVVLVERGTVPKTSSGKLQRAATKRLWQEGELTLVV